MIHRHRLALLGAAAAAAAATSAAIAAPTPATIRVEGDAATIIAERKQAASKTNVADRDGAVRTVAGPTALGQLIRAGAATKTPVRTSFTDAFGPLAALVERIGPDDQGRNFEGPGFWLFKVNHVSSAVAANQKILRRGDEVIWYFTSNFAAAELQLTVPSAPVRSGKRFTVTVTAYDGEGKGAPAGGARVFYSGSAKTASSAGRATFSTKRGVRSLRATRGRDIRSAFEPVCGYVQNRAECSPRRPSGGSLRIVLDGDVRAGWARVGPVLLSIAERGVPAGSTAALAWKGRIFRGRLEVRNAARALARRHLG
ncbi:MAG: DUF4430 domain-containing protein [Thermoleophilia bacterium]|nr:DUF4430 domain-containing protein [Thermoleophilia bacterium]MDH3724637.1 DUF4430 domain-containing protein [Thermoleophilia bacterium]